MNTDETIEYYDVTSRRHFDAWKDDQLALPLLKHLLSLIPSEPAVLDLGCGPGVESKRLFDLGAKVVGIDLSEDSLRLARLHAPEIDFRKMDALDLRFPTRTFNAVLDSAVLFHFDDEEQSAILRSLQDILKEDGRVLSIYRTGKYCGLERYQVDNVEFSRFVNLKSVDAWIDLVLSEGFSSAEKLDFAFRDFEAVLFSR